MEMTNQSKLKPGDVVFGAFATEDGRVLDHYSVVLQEANGACLLAYTTSLKDVSFQGPQRFTPKDMAAANWTKPCRWDGAVVCVVLSKRLRKTGTITPATFAKIQQANQRAVQNRTVSSAMLNEKNEVVVA
jgi:hypothetical protein